MEWNWNGTRTRWRLHWDPVQNWEGWEVMVRSWLHSWQHQSTGFSILPSMETLLMVIRSPGVKILPLQLLMSAESWSSWLDRTNHPSLHCNHPSRIIITKNKDILNTIHMILISQIVSYYFMIFLFYRMLWINQLLMIVGLCIINIMNIISYSMEIILTK